MQATTREWLLVGLLFEMAFAIILLVMTVWVARNRELFGYSNYYNKKRQNKKQELPMPMEKETEMNQESMEDLLTVVTEITNPEGLESVTIDKLDEFGDAEIHRVVKRSEAKPNEMMGSIRRLIDKGADISAKNGDGQTALHLAASRGLDQIMDMLVKEANMDINEPNNNGETALHLAVKNAVGKKVIATCLELGANAYATDSKGTTALHEATMNGDSSENIDVLLLHGANPKTVDRHGKFPLQAALEAAKCNEAAVESLINDGRSPLDSSNDFAKTILHLAAERGYSDIVKLLLNKNVDPDKRDKEGKTPLFLAVEREDERTTKELCKNRARDWGSDVVGRSTIYFAAKYDMDKGFFRIIGADKDDILQQIIVACELGDMLAYMNLTEWAGENPNMPERGVSEKHFFQRLFALVRYSSYKQERAKIAGLLLARQKGNHGPPLDLSKLDRNNTVLSLASKNGLTEIVNLILLVGSQLCCTSKLLTVGTPTPLWQAANSGHSETLAVLLTYVWETDLGQHVAPDDTSPLMMAVMHGGVGAMKQMAKKYNTLEVIDAVAKYGNAKVFNSLKLKQVMSKNMLLAAVEAENYELVERIKEVATTEKDPELAKRVDEINKAMLHVEKEVQRPITNLAIRKLFHLPQCPNGFIKETFLVDELSKNFPKFNPEIEERTFPLLHRHEVSMQEVQKQVLTRFCPLSSYDKPDIIREVSEIPLSECSINCQQTKECAKIRSLIKCAQLLERSMRSDELLGQLCPTFTLTGSVVEGTRFCHATEIDVCVSFSTMAKCSSFRLDCDSKGKIRDAMKVFIPTGIKNFQKFTSSEAENDDIGENSESHIAMSQTFDFSKFLHYFLSFIKGSLIKLSSGSDWPEQIFIQDSWSPDSECCIKERDDVSYSDHSKSLYNPYTHCKNCRPVVTHTKIGATPIFTWKDGGQESVLTADFIPVFPVESPQGFLSLFNAIVSTLVREAPRGGNTYFKGIMAKDRVLPESFQKLLEEQHINKPRKTYDVSMKLLNYGPQNNYIIRPGQIKDDRQRKSLKRYPEKKKEDVINEVYINIKGLKSILGVDIDSYFIKKVIRLEEVSRMILDLDAAKVGLPRKVFDVLDIPELRGYFEDVIDYEGWQEKLEGKAFCEDDKDKIPVKIDGLQKLKMEQRLQIEDNEKRQGFFA